MQRGSEEMGRNSPRTRPETGEVRAMAFGRAAKQEPETVNPWIEPTPVASAELEERPIVVRPRPRKMAGIPELTGGLPRRQLTREERLTPVWLVGAHGGSGCSSVAGLLSHVGDAGIAWPIAPGEEQVRVVLVARESLAGLSAARAALTEWVSGAVPVNLEGLLLVAAQPGGTPRELRALSKLVGSQANGAVWRLSWQKAWLVAEPTMPQDKALAEMQRQLFDVDDSPNPIGGAS